VEGGDLGVTEIQKMKKNRQGIPRPRNSPSNRDLKTIFHISRYPLNSDSLEKKRGEMRKNVKFD